MRRRSTAGGRLGLATRITGRMTTGERRRAIADAQAVGSRMGREK